MPWRHFGRRSFMDPRKIGVSGGFCLVLALMLLLMPLQWLCAALAAACFHELCHYLAIRACGGGAPGLRLYSFAALMPLPEMSRGRELACALAGPVGGLCLLAFARWIPRTAICAGVQSVYNLLPVFPLDGGRAIRCILSMGFPPPRAEKLGAGIEKLCLLGICAMALYGAVVLRLGLVPLIPAALLLIRVKKPCKLARDGIQ